MPGTIHLSICDYIYLFLGVVQNMVKETEHFIASEMEKKHMSQYQEKKIWQYAIIGRSMYL